MFLLFSGREIIFLSGGGRPEMNERTGDLRGPVLSAYVSAVPGSP